MVLALLNTAPRPRWTAVRCLLLLRCPSAIRGFVVPVVVDAVKRHAVGPVAHVGKESQEVSPGKRVPSVANGDTAAAVMGVAGITRIATAPQHRNPTAIRRGSGHAVGLDTGDVLLNRPGLANLGLRFLGRHVHPSTTVVSRYESANHAASGSRHLTTSTFARLGFNRLAFVVALHKAPPSLVAKVWAPGYALATAAGAQRRFQPMASQEVRGLVTKEVFGRDLLLASAFTVHSPSVARA